MYFMDVVVLAAVAADGYGSFCGDDTHGDGDAPGYAEAVGVADVAAVEGSGIRQLWPQCSLTQPL